MRTQLRWCMVTWLLALGGCAGDDSQDMPAGGDAGTDADAGDAAGGGDGGVPDDVCDLRCAPDEAVADSACECGDTGVRMRLGSLDDGFYSQPWPLATRLAADGTLDLEGLPTAPAAAFINDNLDTLATRTPGFSTTGAILMAFTGTIDQDSLPLDAAASLEVDSGAFLVDVDSASPGLGERTPIECRYRRKGTAYHPDHFLSCLPFAGFPLRPATQYALVLTNALSDDEGAPLVATQRLRDVLEARDPGTDERTDDPEGAALTATLIEHFAPLADQLLAEGVALGRIVGATVFRTQDPSAQLRVIAERVQASPAPTGSAFAAYPGELPATESGNYRALQGTFDAPIYQSGETPYASEGGDLRFDEDGEPVLATHLPVRFAITIPDGAMPEAGWPIALYHHGTGGDAFSHIEDGTAFHLADAGVATLGLDAPVHGTRKSPTQDPSALFFNVSNVLALRDNIRQGAIDLLSAEQFVAALDLSTEDSPIGEAVRFDTANLFVMGHSQGSLTAPLMLAFSQYARGAMLSGAGASISGSILYKTTPLDLPALARVFLALAPDEPLDAFHPMLSLVQAYSDSAESSNYVPYFYRWEGGRGLDVWVTSGLLDTEAPPQVTDALATALAIAPVGEFASPVAGLELRGIEPVERPVSENIEAADGKSYTGVYEQYADEGHFLIFNNADAQSRLAHWFQTLRMRAHAQLL